MKLLVQNTNKYNNIKYKLYELDCGIKLIHLQNPASVNFDLAIIHKAGNIYEEIENVPHGTAHFLEHTLFNPNKHFQTQEDIDKFEEGNKSKAGLSINGYTGYKFLTLVGSANEQGASRVVERLNSLLELTDEQLSKALAKEKPIVSAERSRKPKIEKDIFIQRLQFLEGSLLPEFTYNRIGESKDISTIEYDDLKQYLNNRFIKGNVVFAIQSQKNLPLRISQKLEQIGDKYVNRKGKELQTVTLNNSLELGYFYDEKATGTAIELNYFCKQSQHINYQQNAVEDVLNSLIKRVGFDILREQEGLIYSLDAFIDSWYSWYHNVKCYRFVVENSNISKILNQLDEFLFQDVEAFIKSEKGTRWINHILSKYIYPTTTSYNPELPYDIAMTYVEYNELYNHNRYVSEIKKITKKQLIDELHSLQSVPPHIWIESNLKNGNIAKQVKSSPLWSRFK